jgi:2-polyprenyl-3-methyl-5-hydroxy-6-metoxy-1,4-benzoquinol methylase
MDKRQDAFENFEVPDPIRIKKAVDFIRLKFPDLRGKNILECGMAKGGVVDSLKNSGANLFGVDINSRPTIGRVKFFQTDLNGSFPDFKTEFDVIFAGEIMEHLFDDAKFVREAGEILKSGGHLMITVPNLVFSFNRLRMFFGKTPLFAYAPYHYHVYTKKTLKELIESEGFEISKLISSHVLFSTRRSKMGRIFEILGDFFPSLGAHLMIFARKKQ